MHPGSSVGFAIAAVLLKETVVVLWGVLSKQGRKFKLKLPRAVCVCTCMRVRVRVCVCFACCLVSWSCGQFFFGTAAAEAWWRVRSRGLHIDLVDGLETGLPYLHLFSPDLALSHLEERSWVATLPTVCGGVNISPGRLEMLACFRLWNTSSQT